MPSLEEYQLLLAEKGYPEAINWIPDTEIPGELECEIVQMLGQSNAVPPSAIANINDAAQEGGKAIAQSQNILYSQLAQANSAESVAEGTLQGMNSVLAFHTAMLQSQKIGHGAILDATTQGRQERIQALEGNAMQILQTLQELRGELSVQAHQTNQQAGKLMEFAQSLRRSMNFSN